MIITKDVRNRLRALRSEDQFAPGETPSSVAYLLSLFESAADTLDRDEILRAIADEYAYVGDSANHIATLRRRIVNLPDDVLVWVSLAEAASSLPSSRSEAIEAAKKAVALAFKRGSFVRLALGTQARVARRLNDKLLFERAIRALIQDAPNKREGDVGCLPELVADIPDDLCESNLIESYISICHEKE